LTRRADYELVKVSPEIVWIRDQNLGNISVTDDAEGVCRRVWHDYPGRRIIYQDSQGYWDELKHYGGKFTGFAPARGPEGQRRDAVPTSGSRSGV
jgi:hypothetical protein